MNHELTQVMEELGNARLDSHESRRQLQRRELLEKLCRLFPENVVRLTKTAHTVLKVYDNTASIHLLNLLTSITMQDCWYQ